MQQLPLINGTIQKGKHNHHIQKGKEFERGYYWQIKRVKSCVGSGAHTTLSITVENGKWDASQVSNYLQRRTPSAIVNTVVSLGLGLMQRRTPSVMVNTVIRPRPNLPIPCKLKPLRVYI
ncbi:uncharacterized protein LOC143038040 isoform X1 [Oratosquilla oratoria]|uniref:uncharacterized protein LOC143038040 isoform X1 n=1 Tax=Oratosquilla oratoria TaxID=337810 RepID=UPI003F76D0A8